MTTDESGESSIKSLAASFLIAFFYVGSLYVWRSDLDRDHPETIKRRFLSAFCTLWISPPVVYFFGSTHLLNNYSFYQVLGFRFDGLAAALALPLLLTVILFMGPVMMLALTDRLKWFFRLAYWQESLTDWVWWRNHIVAPFTEEFAFRACMLPILLGYYTPSGAILVSPLFFGVAHFHHMIERIRKGQDIQTAFFISAFQFAYTTVFGIYSAFLFIRTGHFFASVIVHGFCNFMGFPDLIELSNQEPRKRLFLIFVFVTGLTIFFLLLWPMTEPNLYQNNIYFW